RLGQGISSQVEVGLFSPTYGNTHFNLRLLDTFALSLDLGVPDEAVNLFVLKFTLSSQTNSDTVTVWRNPANLASEAGSPASGSLSGFNILFNNTTLRMINSSNQMISVDEFRLGT